VRTENTVSVMGTLNCNNDNFNNDNFSGRGSRTRNTPLKKTPAKRQQLTATNTLGLANSLRAPPDDRRFEKWLWRQFLENSAGAEAEWEVPEYPDEADEDGVSGPLQELEGVLREKSEGEERGERYYVRLMEGGIRDVLVLTSSATKTRGSKISGKVKFYDVKL
jgi:hypothetical protein